MPKYLSEHASLVKRKGNREEEEKGEVEKKTEVDRQSGDFTLVVTFGITPAATSVRGWTHSLTNCDISFYVSILFQRKSGVYSLLVSWQAFTEGGGKEGEGQSSMYTVTLGHESRLTDRARVMTSIFFFWQFRSGYVCR